MQCNVNKYKYLPMFLHSTVLTIADLDLNLFTADHSLVHQVAKQVKVQHFPGDVQGQHS